MVTKTIPTYVERSPLAELAEACRIEACGNLDNHRRSAFGQFLTPPHVARLMSSWISRTPVEVRLLDPGAGVGSLTAAFTSEILRRPMRPKIIHVDAFEIEPGFQPQLKRVLEACRTACLRAGVIFEPQIRREDFIEAAVGHLKGADILGAKALSDYTHVVMNPPYGKLHSHSRERLRLREAGIETSNFYTAFMWLAARLLRVGGEFISITPRSFCNGPYFKPFRTEFLSSMSLRRLHVFDSRTAAFNDDGVLQENVIIHAVKGEGEAKRIIISSSNGDPEDKPVERETAYHEVISPNDPEKFFHLAVDDAHVKAKNVMNGFSGSLSDLGLTVSTGRVVDFRAKDYLREEPDEDTVPLIYPCHFNGGFVHWPKTDGRKPNAVIRNEITQNLLVPSGVSIGQSLPRCVGCSSLASKFSCEDDNGLTIL